MASMFDLLRPAAIALFLPLGLLLIGALVDWFSVEPSNVPFLLQCRGLVFLNFITALYALGGLFADVPQAWMWSLFAEFGAASVLMWGFTRSDIVRSDRLLPLIVPLWIIVMITAPMAFSEGARELVLGVLPFQFGSDN